MDDDDDDHDERWPVLLSVQWIRGPIYKSLAVFQSTPIGVSAILHAKWVDFPMLLTKDGLQLQMYNSRP